MYYINLRTNLKITKKLLFKFQKSILRTATILKKKNNNNNTKIQQKKNKIKIINNDKKYNKDKIVANKVNKKN